MIGFIRRNFVNRLIMSPMLKNSKNRLISFWNTKCNWSWLEDYLLGSFPALILLCKTIQGEERKIKCQAIKVYTFCWQNWNQEFTSSQRSTTGNPWQDRQKHFRLTPRCNIFFFFKCDKNYSQLQKWTMQVWNTFMYTHSKPVTPIHRGNISLQLYLKDVYRENGMIYWRR